LDISARALRWCSLSIYISILPPGRSSIALEDHTRCNDHSIITRHESTSSKNCRVPRRPRSFLLPSLISSRVIILLLTTVHPAASMWRPRIWSEAGTARICGGGDSLDVAEKLTCGIDFPPTSQSPLALGRRTCSRWESNAALPIHCHYNHVSFGFQKPVKLGLLLLEGVLQPPIKAVSVSRCRLAGAGLKSNAKPPISRKDGLLTS
jgi:hypothetical protein